MDATEIYRILQENDLATQQDHCIVSMCPFTNTQLSVCFFPCQLLSSWLYAAWSKIASPGATASEHVGILKRSKMGCGQGCFLSPVFNF